MKSSCCFYAMLAIPLERVTGTTSSALFLFRLLLFWGKQKSEESLLNGKPLVTLSAWAHTRFCKRPLGSRPMLNALKHADKEVFSVSTTEIGFESFSFKLRIKWCGSRLPMQVKSSRRNSNEFHRYAIVSQKRSFPVVVDNRAEELRNSFAYHKNSQHRSTYLRNSANETMSDYWQFASDEMVL